MLSLWPLLVRESHSIVVESVLSPELLSASSSLITHAAQPIDFGQGMKLMRADMGV